MAKNDKQTPQPQPKQPVEIEDVRVERMGNEKWRVVVAKYVKREESEVVLEEKVPLHIARATAILWRARKGGVSWGLP